MHIKKAKGDVLPKVLKFHTIYFSFLSNYYPQVFLYFTDLK